LSDRPFVQAVRTDDILPDGMKTVELDGRELVICNVGGTFYAIARRCGHMNAPLEMGTLEGTILTCAMHCAQFDVVTGEALSGPVPQDDLGGGQQVPPRLAAFLRNVAMLMQHIRTDSLAVYPVKVDGGWVWVAL
jgi:3-phenylpropionate/trans-cinnamate dioxygenase ferredoxin subunit